MVRQVSVDLLEKNDKYAAVEGVSSEQEVGACVDLSGSRFSGSLHIVDI